MKYLKIKNPSIIDNWYLKYVNSIDEDDLSKIINFEFVDGQKGSMLVSQILFHIINHGTYHRGFVSDMMYQIPSIPPANDFTVFLKEKNQEI